jgi:hypothetical protein
MRRIVHAEYKDRGAGGRFPSLCGSWSGIKQLLLGSAIPIGFHSQHVLGYVFIWSSQ